MPGYQYLNNGPRLDAIQQIGQTGSGLAGALPQLQLQAQMFRQRPALQRAQELLNEQRAKDAALGAFALGHHLGQAAILQGKIQAPVPSYDPGNEMGATPEDNPMYQAIQAAGQLSARDPRMMSGFYNQMFPQQKPI